MPNSPRELTYSEAIREALQQAMRRDDRVVVIGEGVPDPKGIFGTTLGLKEEFGSERVLDMPLAENGMTGICIGAALNGLRPVMVHQRFDFALLSLDQIINNAAKWYYTFNGQTAVPFVIRLIVGRGWGQGPQHSQSLQAIFAHIPGLKVVMPATARDAKGMLLSAINDDNPVIFIEHRWLHEIRDSVPEEDFPAALFGAKILREGQHVTIAAFSYMVMEALQAAEALETVGIDAEVIDMRACRPLDVETVARSVAKTHNLIVADTGTAQLSISAELIAAVVECAFGELRTAPCRVAAPEHPVPTTPFLANSYYPDALAIALRVANVFGTGDEENERLLVRLRKPMPLDKPNNAFRGPF